MWNRLAARLRREVPNGSLEAFRRAGAAVHGLRLEVDRRAADLVSLGRHPWSAGPSEASAALCVANALVLQTIGETLLDEDYAASPATRGYLPPVTAEQAWACFERVGSWLGWAQQGLAGGDWNLRVEIRLPAELAVWVHDDDYPPQHVRALLVAAGRVAEQLDAACGALATAGEPDPKLRGLWWHARGLADGLRGRLDHATALWQPDPPGALLRQILRESRALLNEQFVLGQVLAAGPLVEQAPPANPRDPAPRRPPEPFRPEPLRLPAPGEPGFDAWCLTCPHFRPAAMRQSAARRLIAELWQYDPEPGRTLYIQGQIEAALRAGAIRYLLGNVSPYTGDGVQRAFQACPWGAIYEVTRPIQIAGARFDVLSQFTFQVSAELYPQTGTFIRRLIHGPFVFTGPIASL
ncbi:MAG: hypothetical protein V7637_4902 [Mycobacteriales bacterium]